MKLSLTKGFSFGLTSGIITTLGLIVGLHSGTHSKKVVLGGILTIAVADAFSDALGIHISEEAENKHTTKEIWQATFSTFLSKFIFALSFAIPMIYFELSTAIVISIIYGLSLITLVSVIMAKKQKTKIWHVVAEHLIIALIVILVTHYVGEIITEIFGAL
ncbi:hypothetical protein JW930_02910 [Candidatus Woesearchaeota archaeon]|nr:hypothetical protein [Candidatus Woesearchaeota archaeon]